MHALHYANELLVRVRLAFLKLLQTRKRAETTRNYQKQVLVMIKHCLGNSQINSIPELRVFLQNYYSSTEQTQKFTRITIRREDFIH